MIVGVDVSSRRIDLAWLEDGKPQRWHQELAKGHLIDRLRSIQIQWPDQRYLYAANPPVSSVQDVAIEYPFGRGNAIAALMATVGVITRQAPPWARVAWPSSGELRRALGCRDRKELAHFFIMGYFTEHWVDDWNEHELDALVACLGWTKILEAQDA